MRLTMYVLRNDPTAALVDGEPAKLFRVELGFARPPRPDGLPWEPLANLPKNDPTLLLASSVVLGMTERAALEYGQPVIVEIWTAPVVAAAPEAPAAPVEPPPAPPAPLQRRRRR